MTESQSEKGASASAAEHSNESEATFSTLILSLASSSVMALGLTPNPTNGKIEKDLRIARFNIDLLSVLQRKTTGNLSPDEARFLDSVINDLRLKFIQAS